MTNKPNLADPAMNEPAAVPAAEKTKRARKLGGDAPTNPISSERSKPHRPAAATRPSASKSDIVVSKLRAAKGATIEALMAATGWQAHSVRGFLSGTVRKKLGLPLESDIGKNGHRCYRLAK